MIQPTKEDLINALSVMKTVLDKAKLVSTPCDTMIEQIKDWEVFDDNDMQRAFLLGIFCTNPSINGLSKIDLTERYNQAKAFYNSNQ